LSAHKSDGLCNSSHTVAMRRILIPFTIYCRRERGGLQVICANSIEMKWRKGQACRNAVTFISGKAIHQRKLFMMQEYKKAREERYS
jgi:hypothetical protein